MEPEDSYKPGTTVFYHEAGQIFQAEVLQNNSDDACIQYKLRLMRQVSGQRNGEIPEGGLEITVIKGHGSNGATWQVSRLPRASK